jgi:hypothetical protein
MWTPETWALMSHTAITVLRHLYYRSHCKYFYACYLYYSYRFVSLYIITFVFHFCTSQMISHWSFTIKAQDWSQANLYGIFAGRSVTGRIFAQSTFVFLLQYIWHLITSLDETLSLTFISLPLNPQCSCWQPKLTFVVNDDPYAWVGQGLPFCPWNFTFNGRWAARLAD